MYIRNTWWRQMAVRLGVLFTVTCTLATVLTVTPPMRPQRNALEHIKYWNRLRKFAALIQQYNMSEHFERQDITVFVPISTSYDTFLADARRYGYDTTDRNTIERILLYHIADGITSVSNMATRRSVMTLHPGSRRLFFNSFPYGDTTVHTVNGAWLEQPDIVARNGMVHLIDRFIIPLQSTKTVADYLETPDIPNLAFQSIKNASIVDVPLKLATNSTTHRFTVFAPNDSYITGMADYGKDILFNDTALLKSVFWAHVVEEVLLYIPRLGDIPHTAAKAGILKFHRIGSETYVCNSRVRARVVQANLPVENGVVHVIDNLLFFVYKNIRQTIETLDNVHFMRSSMAKLDAELLVHLADTSRTITFFLPIDEAFAKIPSDQQIALDNNYTLLTKMYKDHIIMYAERDFDSFQDGETFTTADGKMLTMRRIKKEVYVEGGGVRARVVTSDIGCTNGVIHLINSVLFQRDFTIWDAILGNSQLSTMGDFIKFYNSDLISTLRETREGPMTVFLISDAAVNGLPQDTRTYIDNNAGLLIDAIKGSIAHGVILSSTQISDEQEVPTLSGRTITLYNTNQGLYVVGSRIRANVVIEDIWCSNGVLHITDNIVHLPTRNILDEMEKQPTLSVISGLLSAFPDVQSTLQDMSSTYTVFMASDDAFTHMPTHRARTLSKSPALLKQIIQGHIIEGSQHFVEQFQNYSKLTSLSGDYLFVIKMENKAFAVSNNVRGHVTDANIRCTNGIIHVIDTLLQYPFWTVAEVMESTLNLKPFFDMLHTIDDFYTWSASYSTNLTMFVPSASFLAQLSDFHRTFILSEPGMVRKIFNSHALPTASLNQRYLHSAFQNSRVYMTENRYNYTFTLFNMDPSDKAERLSVDVGYSNLRQTFDMVTDGIGCSNGVIYVINGFLNYPLYNTLEEIKRQPEISIGTDQLIKLIPGNASLDLTSKDTVFTVFAPADDSFNFLTMNDINYINQNLSYTERMQIVRRHIVKGQRISYDNIVDGTYNRYAVDRSITVLSRTDGFYLRWKDIEAKIIRQNILSTNGIIHVVDRLLLTTPYQTTTLPPTTTTMKQVSSAKTNSSYTNFITVLVCNIVTVISMRILTLCDDYR